MKLTVKHRKLQNAFKEYATENQKGWDVFATSVCEIDSKDKINKDSDNCWRKQGCLYNSNFPNFLRCNQKGYSMVQCKSENKDWDRG